MFGFIPAYLSKDRKLYVAIKNILGFYPENIFLYQLAFRHKSASEISNGFRRNNERLEYLGDAVLSVVAAHYLFERYPNQDEGFLTEMRSKMVSRATLNKVGMKMGLHSLIRIEQNSQNGFKSVDGDALEALVGAIFLDKGFRFTEKVILNRIISLHIDVDEMEHKEWNFKSKLIDWGQKEKCNVHFQVLETINRGQKKLYKIDVIIDGVSRGQGIDHSIKSAEQLAAENACKNYVEKYMASQDKDRFREPILEEDHIIPKATLIEEVEEVQEKTLIEKKQKVEDSGLVLVEEAEVIQEKLPIEHSENAEDIVFVEEEEKNTMVEEASELTSERVSEDASERVSEDASKVEIEPFLESFSEKKGVDIFLEKNIISSEKGDAKMDAEAVKSTNQPTENKEI
ncbi:MAG: ribonuclease III [Bacteroidales bacterium]